MKIKYEKKFVKDLKGLDVRISKKLQHFIFELKSFNDLSEIKNLRKMVGYKEYFRLRMGEFRLGLKYENDTLIFQRVKHRKDIYRVFP